jgi:hypothetical protein
MAEKGHSENKGMSLGLIFLLIVLGVFVIWVLTGGPSKNTSSEKIIEKSVWPPTNEIPSYGPVNNN